MSQQNAAASLFAIDWETPQLGWLECPGIGRHTGKNHSADCRITLDDGKPPTIFCFHSSCSDEVAEANKRLRSALGKAERKAEPIRHSVVRKPESKRISLEPVTPPQSCGSALDHINACFDHGENVCVVLADAAGAITNAGGTTLAEDAHTIGNSLKTGVFVRVNPMRNNGTRNEDVTAFRHVLIECDDAPKPLQWAAIVASGLPVSVVVDSGGKSLHAWVRVDAENSEEYRQRGKQAADAMDAFEGIRVDRACLNPARLARLAGHARGESRQELIALHIGAASWDNWQERTLAPDPVTPIADRPFLILGNLNRVYYYLSRQTGTLVALTSAQHTRNALMELAPLAWWEQEHDKRGDALIQVAVDHLLQTAARIEFSPSHIRGRGAWLDEGRVVFHAGNTAIVDGATCDLLGIGSRYVYARSERLGVSVSDPLGNADANRLRELIGCFQFANPLDSLFLSGWLVTAMICGAMDWRPHVWLTGAAGSGKTTILSEVIEPLLGDVALNIQGNTTEAGIRQALSHDARPVIFDEAEGDDERGRDRMAQVLALARASSRESGALMLKGSAGGQSMSFRIRSSFLFSSIAVSIDKRADQGRISVLELIPEHLRTMDRFEEAKRLMSETVDRPEWCARWRARCISLAAVVAYNATVFKSAARSKLDEQRNADQVGALLAGAYALTSEERIDVEPAERWVDGQDWAFARGDRGDTDERTLLNRLLESWLQVETFDGPNRARITVAEAIRQVSDENEGRARFAAEALARIGVRVWEDCVDIANSGTELRERFGVVRWADQLRRFRGAQKMESQVLIGAMRKRTTRLPLEII
jgi:putative DNA primase/helicase